jgi:hypothetical protein
MSLERIENSIPPIADGEDRHVEHKHRIVHSPAGAKYVSPSGRETSSIPIDFRS